jgi:hypothetical protein
VPELVTIPNITLVETGTWNASTGEVTFTSDDLYAAVAALDDPAIKTPRMRFGHTSSTATLYESSGGFDSQPCVGKFTNLRVEGDGTALVGDLVGVPQWLAEVLPVAYPNRSVEAYFEVKTSTGKKHPMVITSVALLGEELPAVQTLDDLELLFSEEGSPEWIDALSAGSQVAASRKEESMPTRVAASVDSSDVRKAFYEQIATEESGRYWWWIHQVYLDPKAAIAEDDNGEYWMCEYSFSGNEVQFEEPRQVFIQWVDTESGKVAAEAGPTFGRPAARFASAADSRPAERQKKYDNQQKETQSMPIDIAALRTALGVDDSVLPDDATEEQINTAIAAGPQTAEVEETEETEGDTVGEVPVAVAAQGAVIDPEMLRQLQADAAAGREARAAQVLSERTQFVDTAVRAGKIPPARKGHYLSLLERDDAGTRDFINKLEAGVVPLSEKGSSETDEGRESRLGSGHGSFPGARARARRCGAGGLIHGQQ